MSFFNRLLGKKGVALQVLIDEVPAYFEERFGPVDNVFHEIVSDAVHIDVHQILPNEKCDHVVLFTTGMSMRRMKGEIPFGEMVIFLPGDWNFEVLDREENYWPIRNLKMWAKVHVTDGFRVVPFLSMPIAAEGGTAPGTRFDALMSLDLGVLGQGYEAIRVSSGEEIVPMLLVPLLPDETEFKIRHPETHGLWAELGNRGANLKELFVVDPGRGSLLI